MSARPSLFRRAFEALAAAILGLLSRERNIPSGGTSAKEPLKVLQREYPSLRELIAGKSVLDYGCGHGEQSRALASTYGCTVTGYDNNPRVLNEARQKPTMNVRFVDELDDEQYDFVISLNSMEHFRDPQAVLDSMHRALKPEGVILLSFGAPWFSPFGSHMHFFCRLPWVNVLFPEAAVMKVRAKYRSDGARRYEEVESGLNKMSLAKFERLIERPGIRVMSRRYTAVKRLNALCGIPMIRELMTNHVTVILQKAAE